MILLVIILFLLTIFVLGAGVLAWADMSDLHPHRPWRERLALQIAPGLAREMEDTQDSLIAAQAALDAKRDY